MDASIEFKPQQILCLDHGESRLYVEVIQVVTVRQLCWVRPLVLAIAPSQLDEADSQFYDLRHSADLLWATASFRAALDTEVVPLLARLGSDKLHPEGDRAARQRLQDFLNQFWQAKGEQ